MSGQGTFIISLDFELNWGVHDVFTLEQYGEHIRGVRTAVPRMLALFEQYEIHATWATVSMLCFKDKDELINHLPAILPTYENHSFSPYAKLHTVGENEETDPYHFGQSLVLQILQVPNQEIGTHTFSHYYCLEEGQKSEQFQADLHASLNVPCLQPHTIRSLVFPRNQTNADYLAICKQLGIEAYRGNEKHAIYKATGYNDRSKVKRAIRLLDAYVNLTGHHTYKLQHEQNNVPVNVRSSRFLRPYHPTLKFAEPLRLQRIKKGIEHAAKHGEVYHLWWHPHNFGTHVNENLSFLQKILAHVYEMKEKYGLQSKTMGEAASAITQNGTKNKNPL